MTSADWLLYAQQTLTRAGIATARLDTLILLEDCLKTDRALILAHPEREISNDQQTVLNLWLAKRYQQIPLAYIRGHTEFYGRDFIVDEHVLVPRPESEALIELLKTITVSNQSRLADIGSGSGCLGITAALEFKIESVSFHDIDPQTLRIARKNAETYHIQPDYYETDLLGDRSYDIVLANLPYVSEDYPVNTAARHEPALALYSGIDGLSHYRRLFQQSQQHPDLTYIVTESFPAQHNEMRIIASNNGYSLLKSLDFGQLYERTSSL